MIGKLTFMVFQICLMSFILVMFQMQLDDMRRTDGRWKDGIVYRIIIPPIMMIIGLMIIIRVITLISLLSN